MTELAKTSTYTETAMRRVVRGLTDAEVCELARKAGDAEHTARSHERELEAMKLDVAESKKTIEMTLNEARDYLQMVDRGTTEEIVECGVVYDVASNRMGYIRLDTGECVEVRGIWLQHAQMSIEDAARPAPTEEQVALLDAFELEHGRFAVVPAIEDDEDE